MGWNTDLVIFQRVQVIVCENALYLRWAMLALEEKKWAPFPSGSSLADR